MLRLSDQLSAKIQKAQSSSEVSVDDWRVCVFFSEIETELSNNGFLNIAFQKKGMEWYGLPISSLENLGSGVKHQERMVKPNTSPIMGISVTNQYLILNHWDGFRTKMDLSGYSVIGQEFTK